MTLRRHQRFMLWAGGVSLVIWAFEPLYVFLLPLVFYNTHIHEMCHALATIATGGQVEFIRVFADGSGVTQSRGGSVFFLASAGYVGSSLVGGILLRGSRSARSSRKTLMVALGFLVFSMIFFVRGDLVGVLTGYGWIIILALTSRFLKDDAVVFFAQFLGVQQCLTSVQAFSSLIAASSTGSVHNDAGILQQSTHVPAIIWALLWMFCSLFVMFISLRNSWKSPSEG